MTRERERRLQTAYGNDVTDWHSWQEGRRFGRSEAMAGFPRFLLRVWWWLS